MAWLTAFIVGTGAVAGLVSLWLVLRFLRHVYDKGGRADLTAAASAIRVARWPRLGRNERAGIGNGEHTNDTSP